MTQNSNDSEQPSFPEIDTPFAVAPTGTGLDRIIPLIHSDLGLAGNNPPEQIEVGADCAAAMNQIIVEAANATGAAADGMFTEDEVRAMNVYIRTHHLIEWGSYHGDDEGGEETGFHNVQNDGAITDFRGENFVNTVLDGIYHLGFEIVDDRFYNEDGNANARVEDVARWLTALYTDHSNTGTRLDLIVDAIIADGGLAMNLDDPQIFAGADAANALNHLIVEAISATGALADNWITNDELVAMNAYLRVNHAAQWAALHGDDEGDVETGFHNVQGDGANTPVFGRNLVDTVADGIYHIGFPIENGRFLNEDGDPNARVSTVASWLNFLLADQSTTGTGLDQIVDIIKSDPGLVAWTSARDINTGAASADAMNHLIVEAIDATGTADDHWFTSDDVRLLNGYIREHHAAEWVTLHGTDQDDESSGFHLVQGHGGRAELFEEGLIDTVADGIYHLGFEIEDGRFLNEEGDPSTNIGDVADWLNHFYNSVWIDYGTGDSELMQGTSAAEEIVARGGNDTVITGDGNDYALGGSGNDTLHGGGGDDRLDGERGDDAILGGEGNDTIVGGRGTDIFLGGGGADTFVYDSDFGPVDGIFDFNRAQGDKIQLAPNINGSGIATPEDVLAHCISPDGVNGFILLGSDVIILVGVPNLQASDFVIG